MRDKIGFFYKFILTVVIAIIALISINKFETGLREEKIVATNVEEIEETLRSTLVACYAIEGAYPSNLKYLENYGIIFDYDKYIYEYSPNISYEFPDIKVSLR